MRLPDEIFSRICDALGAAVQVEAEASAPAGGAEAAARRRERRWRVDAEVPLGTRPPKASLPAERIRLTDISPTGVSAFSPRQWAPGDRVVLCLPLGQGEFLPVACAVRSSRVKLDGTFRLGLQFDDEPDGSAERVVGEMFRSADPPAGRAAAAASREGRRSERNEAQGRATIYTYGEFGEAGPIEQVAARDYSDHGVCIIRTEPLKVGSRFMVRLPVADARPITRLCRVRNVFKDGPRYRIGAEFVPFPGAIARAAGLARAVTRWVWNG